jgi:hypothetical protein
MRPQKDRKSNIKFQEPLIIAIFWLLLFASPLVFGNNDNGINWTHIISIWKMFIPYLGVFLMNRFILLPIFFFRGKRLYYYISAIFLILVLSAGAHLYETKYKKSHFPRETRMNRPGSHALHIPPGEGLAPPPEHMRPLHGGPNGNERPILPPKVLPPFLSFFVISILIAGFDTGLKVSVRYAQSEQKRVNAEKENIETKLAFLQNQVSPHFLMNTLNNIHSQIDIDAEEAKESIIKLSKLMRHLLYDSQGDYIALQKEIDFITAYVELMQLRYSEKVKIELHIPEGLPEKSIPPLIFTSFVENAFKHGISYQEDSFIDIRFSYDFGKLNFEIRNSNPGSVENNEASGIGLENSRKRLEILFGDNYSLDIKDAKDIFIVNLTIPT